MVIGHAPRHPDNSLYRLPFPVVHQRAHIVNEIHVNTELYHRQLAHMNMMDLCSVHRHTDGVPQLPKSNEVRLACRLVQAHKLPFPGHFMTAGSVGYILHSDIVGPLELSIPDRQKYVLSVLDEHSRYLVAGFMQNKIDTSSVFKASLRMLASLHGDGTDEHYNVNLNFKRINSDGVKENVRLEKNLRGYIEKSFSPPYTRELNAISERENRTMEDGARYLLIQANLA